MPPYLTIFFFSARSGDFQGYWRVFRSAYSQGATKSNIQVFLLRIVSAKVYLPLESILHFSHLFLYLEKAAFKAKPLQKLTYFPLNSFL